MIKLLIVFSLSFNCMLDELHNASGMWWSKTKKLYYGQKASKKHLKFLLKELIETNNGYLDTRYLAIAMIESGARVTTRAGDRGRACGVFQIHARYSYPFFNLNYKSKLKWKDNSFPDKAKKIKQECSRLSTVKYSVRTMKKLMNLMDKDNKHPCHHNSGIYTTRCDQWYKERINLWTLYFEIKKQLCSLKGSKK